VAGTSAEELYLRAQEWVAQTFEDPRQVIQFADPQRHLLLGSGYTQLLFRRNNGTVKNTAPFGLAFGWKRVLGATASIAATSVVYPRLVVVPTLGPTWPTG
jgi:hypothetical protein